MNLGQTVEPSKKTKGFHCQVSLKIPGKIIMVWGFYSKIKELVMHLVLRAKLVLQDHILVIPVGEPEVLFK